MDQDQLTLALSPQTLEFSSHLVTVLLIDDQPIVAEALRKMLQEAADIKMHYCQDPAKAIEMASQVNPTIILQDLIMPEIDGLLLVRYFRANPATRDIPLIVLSTKEEPTVKESAFVLGANDYLVKLPDKVELLARIRYHSLAYIRLLQRNEAYNKLAASQRVLHAELAEAAEYVRSTLPAPLTGSIEAYWKFIPSTQLGGDSFSYHWIDPDHFAIYLLDVCGHGVGAALLSVSINNNMRSENVLNVDLQNPSEVLSALNDLYPMEKHHDMFSTIWYGVYNKNTRELRYSCAGHPPAILLNGASRDSAETLLLKTAGAPIGTAKDIKVKSESVKIEKFNKLYIFSDGVYEHKTPEGTILEYDEFVSYVAGHAKAGGSDLEGIEAYARSFVEESFSDDFSIIQGSFH